MKFHSTTEVRLFLEKLCEEYELCPKYCHLQSNVDSCFHYQIKKCRGICSEKETIETYNQRVMEAIDSVKFQAENFIIKEQGRNSNEHAYILISNGIYKGFGYANKDIETITLNDYYEIIDVQNDNNDIKRILNAYLKKNTNTIEILTVDNTQDQPFNLFAS